MNLRSSVGACLIAVLLTMSGLSCAQNKHDTLSLSVFSQQLSFTFPKGFAPISEQKTRSLYIRESVPQGESGLQWSQMITVTGTRDGASGNKVTPHGFASLMGNGFRRVCPESYNGTELALPVSADHDTFAAVISCGAIRKSGVTPYSESTLVLVIRGERDYYTIQWAERGDASDTPIEFDEPKWRDRLQRLMPVRLCPNIPGQTVACATGK